MAVHGSGDGASWIEDLDVDQPQGLDYRQFNHMAVGIRKRISSGHTPFADSTAGGVHIPGGAGVVGWGDGTPTVDGTFKGRGLVYDGTGVLWCSSSAAEATTSDWTILKLNPDLQWDSGDVTWAGNHQFDNTILFKDNVDISGDVLLDGSLVVLKPSEFTSAVFDGSVDISGSVGVDGDFSIDGTIINTTIREGVVAGIDFSGTIDCTGQFNLTNSSLGQPQRSYTYLPNGVIMQFGKITAQIEKDSTGDITFNFTFPTALRSLVLSYEITAKYTAGEIGVACFTSDVTGFGYCNASDFSGYIHYTAIGY